MQQDQNLLQQNTSQIEPPQLLVSKSSNDSPLPEKVRRFFKGYQHTLNAIADQNKERQMQLQRLQQFYENKIAQLEERIETLESLLEQSQQQLRQKLSQSNLSPQSNTKHKAIKEEACTPVTIDFRRDYEEEQCLLDDLETDYKHKPTPKLVQSIIVDSVDELNTTKKQGRRTSLHESIKPSRFLMEQFDATSYEPVKDMKEDPFQSELKTVKQELATLRSCLISEGVDIAEIGHQKLMPDQICVRLIQMQESRHVKEHLTNENNELRKRANIYARQLKAIGPELVYLKKLLLAAIDD